MKTFLLITIAILLLYGFAVTLLNLGNKAEAEKYKTLSMSQKQELNKVWFMYKDALYRSKNREKDLTEQLETQQRQYKSLMDMSERMSRSLQKVLYPEGSAKNEKNGK